ncbi:winged helix-turn-helix domain-containing protein [Bradyrhizobium sp. CCGUVB1N3]|uniref:winged helix-turn-helix domain-containing protein n=1 Tax=Bradyrhizobium sp. CCGUVB1N3 TaxID=2949629 RepID=UPI0020B388E3|nr:winged helix-turn-helix domain-containing protein [Bradyrhizobium sp. CCGUVB1N3]MCP3469213.1 winged helix-turn-helix domain-containing protein [Bradyrhizobium sp. CCGUVB1N3]
MFHFADFELDPQRAELRGRNGETIRLRPKSFDMLELLATNAGRVLSKQELIEALWPDVHVSDDSLFQCIREIRAALGDEKRELIRLVSGRGYLFDVAVSRASDAIPVSDPVAPEAPPPAIVPDVAAQPPTIRSRFAMRGPAAFAVAAALVTLVGLATAAPILAPRFIFTPKPPVISVTPIAAASGDAEQVAMAAEVTGRLTNGLAKIDGIRVVAPQSTAPAAPQVTSAVSADLVVSGEVQKTTGGWEVRARMIASATGEVRWAGTAVVADEGGPALQQMRLAAGIGHPLALRINALVSGAAPSGRDAELAAGRARVAIEQASAVINQTSHERFSAAQAMLEKALAADPDNVDIEVALASHLMRGIQSVWYDPADVAATESRARAMLEHALRAKAGYVPVLEAYCRFLTATNSLSESLVACARALSFDPWHGTALYNLGLTQMLQGRFDDALSTFRQADDYGTPQVSRWTWLLGTGLVYALTERYAEALPWLERSLAITAGTGRSQMLLAAVYYKLGRYEEAKAEMVRGLALRPGSSTVNIALPTKNASQAFIAGMDRLLGIQVEIGLPTR